MAIENRITFQKLPKVEQSSNYDNESRESQIPYPDGSGWRLAYSIRGEFNICHVWKKGGIQYDRGYENTWTSKGDNISTNQIGQGQTMVITNEVDLPEKQVDIEFLPASTYMHGGAVSWQDASVQDSISVEVIALATDIIAGGNLSVTIVDNKIVPTERGAGTHEIAGMPTVVDSKGNTGYWNFSNGSLLEAPNQDGNVDLYTVDMAVACLVNNLPTVPTTSYGQNIKSENAWKVLPGYKFRFKTHNVSNTTWTATLSLAMFRKQTIDY